NREPVALVAEPGERDVDRERDVRTVGGPLDRQRQTGRGSKLVAKHFDRRAKLVRRGDRGGRGEDEGSRSRRCLRGYRDEGRGGHHGMLARARYRALSMRTMVWPNAGILMYPIRAPSRVERIE